MSGDLRALRVQESDCLVKFEGNTADLLMLARGVVRGDNVESRPVVPCRYCGDGDQPSLGRLIAGKADEPIKLAGVKHHPIPASSAEVPSAPTSCRAPIAPPVEAGVIGQD